MLKALALAASYPPRPLLLPFFLELDVALVFSLVFFIVDLLEVLEAAGFFIMPHFFLILSLVVGTSGTSVAESPESESGLYFVGLEERQLSVWPS